MPIPPGTVRIAAPLLDFADSGAALAIYRTGDSMSAVAAFFAREMPRAGWTAVPLPAARTDGRWLGRFTRDGRDCLIFCAPDPRGRETLIVIRALAADGKTP